MKILRIVRGDNGGPVGDEGTFGVATLDNHVWCSLELPWRDYQPNISCIPPGTYQAVKIYSPHFNRMIYRLVDVPGRSEVEIHPANWAGDTSKGWYSDLRGCITLGAHAGSLVNPHGKVQLAVVQSTPCIDTFMAAVGDDTLQVTIIDPSVAAQSNTQAA